VYFAVWIIYVDVPGTTVDHVIAWAEVAVLNAGLHGIIGAAISRLLRAGLALTH